MKSTDLPPETTAPPSISPTTLSNKVVDFRKERAILQDLAYLTGTCGFELGTIYLIQDVLAMVNLGVIHLTSISFLLFDQMLNAFLS